MTNTNLDVHTLTEDGKIFLSRLSRYVVVFFLLLLIAVYGFVLLRIESLHNIQPSDASVTSQVQSSATPQVDPTVVQQMQTLQDNSVSVKSLFDQARNSPFQE